MKTILILIAICTYPGFQWVPGISKQIEAYIRESNLDLKTPRSKLLMPGVLNAGPVDHPSSYWSLDSIDLNGDDSSEYVGLYRTGAGRLRVVAFFKQEDRLIHQVIGDFGADSGTIHLVIKKARKKSLKRYGSFKSTQDIYPQIQNDGFRITGSDSDGAFYWEKGKFRRVKE